MTNRIPNELKVHLDRRAFLAAALGGLTAASAAAQAPAQQPQVSPVPTPRDWSRRDPLQYPDPDIVALDNRFRRYIVGNTPIQRLYAGTLWAEGPAWNGVGRYLVWSDIPNNVQMRWIEEYGRGTTFGNPSQYTTGNTLDYEGRQLSCEHVRRHAVRHEPKHSDAVRQPVPSGRQCGLDAQRGKYEEDVPRRVDILEA